MNLNFGQTPAGGSLGSRKRIPEPPAEKPDRRDENWDFVYRLKIVKIETGKLLVEKQQSTVEVEFERNDANLQQ